MKNLLTAANNRRLTIKLRNTLVLLLIGTALAFTFWTATAPTANGQTMTPMEMLQSKMAAGTTLAQGSKDQVLDAVCAAVRKWRMEAPQIVRTAAGARKEFARDIVITAVRCLKDKGFDCDLVGRTLAGGIDASPENAADFTEAVIQVAPECRDALGRPSVGVFEDPPVNVNPPPGVPGGGGGDQPGGGACQVCHHGVTTTISCNDLQEHLDHGDEPGPCPPTPTQNP